MIGGPLLKLGDQVKMVEQRIAPAPDNAVPNGAHGSVVKVVGRSFLVQWAPYGPWKGVVQDINAGADGYERVRRRV